MHGRRTQTAVLRAKNDIMTSTDQSEAVVLVLLDLLTAFEAFDRDDPSYRLEKLFDLLDSVFH